MSQQGMPNPVEFYQAASKHTREVIAGVKPDQMKDSTPCSEWDVKALTDHLIGGAAFFSAALLGEEPKGPPEADSPAEAYDTLAAGVVEAANTPGSLERKVQSPLGETTGGEFLFAAFMDTVVHGWDLAKATGQDTAQNGAQVEIIHQAFAPMMGALREQGAFGPEVEVPEAASTQDKMLGMMGRQS